MSEEKREAGRLSPAIDEMYINFASPATSADPVNPVTPGAAIMTPVVDILPRPRDLGDREEDSERPGLDRQFTVVRGADSVPDTDLSWFKYVLQFSRIIYLRRLRRTSFPDWSEFDEGAFVIRDGSPFLA